jgi:hypothetical protein
MALRAFASAAKDAGESEAKEKLDSGRIADCLAWCEMAQRKVNDIFPSWSGELGALDAITEEGRARLGR